MGLELGQDCIVLSFLSVGDKPRFNDVLKKVFAKSITYGCWRVEIHVFTMGFGLEGVIEATRDAILSNIHLSLVIYEYNGLSELNNVLTRIKSRIEANNIKKVFVYVSPGISKDVAVNIREVIPSEYTEFLSQSL